MKRENIEALWIIFVALFFFGIIAWGIFNWPTCKSNEVLVRGVWGYVCVEGHR